MSQFYFDELTDTPTILSTGRAKRPDQTSKPKDPNAPQICFFCKGSEHLTPSTLYKDADDWNVRVFKNAFPLVEDHEVVVHSPSHDKDLADLPHDHVVKYVRALLNRVNYYTSREKEVLIINNRGGRAGASIAHAHSQILALAGFPGMIEKEKSSALTYYNEKNSCYWCDNIIAEAREVKRVVAETQHFILMVPQASRWSYEMLLVPKTHRPNFEYINDIEINDFVNLLQAACNAYDELLGKPDRNFWMHTQRFEPYHWHMGFIPHTKVLGGLELGAGIWVSDKATPEDAAAALGPIVKAYLAKATAGNPVSSIT
jgi:UDPglucose--hexose-1-phosphate uridylyltransferase